MSYSSLRDFMTLLEGKGLLVRVTEPVSTALEMTEIQTRLLAEGGPAVLFENAVKADGTPAPMPVLVNLFDTVNLAQEAPELSSVDGQPLIDVELQRVFFDVLENTLTVETPEMGVYVAPETVTSPAVPQALLIGTIPPIPAGMTVTNQDMVLAPDGNANLQMFMSDFSTPFNIIVGTTVEVEADDPVPSGRLRARIGADASAGL